MPRRLVGVREAGLSAIALRAKPDTEGGRGDKSDGQRTRWVSIS